MSWDVSYLFAIVTSAFLCHVLGRRLALVSVTVLFARELLVLAENTGASGQGLRFQEEPEWVR